MAETLILSAEEIEEEDLVEVLIYDSLVWEDLPTDQHRWEEWHTGVTKYKDKYWWIKWVTGLTENQDNQYFEYELASDGSLTLHEAESYEVTETKWRIKK
jgi:hypothetical protein